MVKYNFELDTTFNRSASYLVVYVDDLDRCDAFLEILLATLFTVFFLQTRTKNTSTPWQDNQSCYHISYVVTHREEVQQINGKSETKRIFRTCLVGDNMGDNLTKPGDT